MSSRAAGTSTSILGSWPISQAMAQATSLASAMPGCGPRWATAMVPSSKPQFALENFGVEQGWRVDRHPRFVIDLDGDGHADIIGFGDQGVWVALGDGHGGFSDAQFVLENFGYNQGWRVDKHPRFVAKLTSGKFLDIVGFGDAGVWTALGMDKGAFNQANFVLANFGVDQSWRVDKHPRFVVDINGNGHADIVGFGDAGVWTALGDGNGGFPVAQFVLDNFGYDQGWRVDKHPRFVANLTSRGFADIVGFGDAGVWTASVRPTEVLMRPDSCWLISVSTRAGGWTDIRD